MGYFVMAARTQDEPQVDDYVVWTTIDDVPVMRGTKAEVREFWRQEFGRANMLAFANAFVLADQHGSNSQIGNGHWNDELRTAIGAKAGILPRARLREFLDLYFDPAELDIDEHEAVAERLIALLEPFDWEDAETAGDGS